MMDVSLHYNIINCKIHNKKMMKKPSWLDWILFNLLGTVYNYFFSMDTSGSENFKLYLHLFRNWKWYSIYREKNVIYWNPYGLAIRIQSQKKFVPKPIIGTSWVALIYFDSWLFNQSTIYFTSVQLGFVSSFSNN